MIPRAWPRRLACALTVSALGVSSLLVAPAAEASAGSVSQAASARTPLRVTISTLAPATIPQRGRVRLSGTITNRSQETWSNLNVYLVTSEIPIRSRAELAKAARSDPDAPIGNRRTAPGSYVKAGDLEPGESIAYRLSVRRKDLGISGQPGVYWVGVHVLGEHGDGRDTVADGRARTFMPLMPSPGSAAGQRSRTRLALIVPLKSPVRRGPAGRLSNIDGWRRTLSPDGRLDRVLRLSSRDRQPFTWAIDPAVLDAAQSVARDNPPLDPGPTGGDRGGSSAASSAPSSDPSTDPTPTQSPSGQQDQDENGDNGSGSTDGDQGSLGSSDGTTRKPSQDAVYARTWLAEFRRQVGSRTVAALPYADLDVAAALGQPRGSGLTSVYDQAVGLSDTTLAGYGVDHPTHVVAPTGGYLPGTALHRVHDDTPVVLTQAALPDAKSSVVAPPDRAPVVLTDAAASSGGPAPNSQYAAIPVRQRLLSDAALHALSGDRDEPVVATLPQYWNPGEDWATSNFFSGLSQPWLQMIDLTSLVATAPTAPRGSTATPTYPESDREAQLPPSNLVTTRNVTRTGEQLDRLLSANHSVDDDVARIAMLASSYNTRIHPPLLRRQAAATGAYLRAQMSRVRVEGPAFVMMSGESGPIQVTIVNGLDETVTVGLRVVTTPGSELRLERVDPVTLGPGRRTSIRLQAHSRDIGVHSVTLVTTDATGEPLGSSARFSVRTSNVSTVIWVIMAIGGALLLVAIVVRLYRRIRRRKSTHGPLLPREPTDRPGQELNA